MDNSESVAYKYLSFLGLGNIRYEPDGNVPPDFLVDERIAVEVRRLNQNEVAKSGIRGLEEIRIPLHRNLVKLLTSLGPPTNDQSWFVSYEFCRPVAPWTKLKKEISKYLEAFKKGLTKDTEFDITDNFHLRLLPASKVQTSCFIPGGYMDLDSGGWVIPELERNIRICVDEKRQKVTRAKKRYPEWWLILIDHINYAEKEILQIEHDWDKIILIDPRDPSRAYEI